MKALLLLMVGKMWMMDVLSSSGCCCCVVVGPPSPVSLSRRGCKKTLRLDLDRQKDIHTFGDSKLAEQHSGIDDPEAWREAWDYIDHGESSDFAPSSHHHHQLWDVQMCKLCLAARSHQNCMPNSFYIRVGNHRHS